MPPPSRPKQHDPRPSPRLYLATEPVVDAAALAADIGNALGAADVAAVLLRLADGDERALINRIKTLAPVVQDHGVALIVEGRTDLVARGGADGAHVAGVAALPGALEQLKPDRIVGVGSLMTRHDAMIAAESGADYVMFGDDPRQDAAMVLERAAWWAELFEIPCVAFARSVGDITPLIAAGADFIALDFVWRDPRGAAAALLDVAPHLRLPETETAS